MRLLQSYSNSTCLSLLFFLTCWYWIVTGTYLLRISLLLFNCATVLEDKHTHHVSQVSHVRRHIQQGRSHAFPAQGSIFKEGC